MFRLLPSGLPKDPVFPSDLKDLGYFINEEDEIRSIDNPRAYFNFFLTKNEHYNAAQRQAFDGVIRNEVTSRLHHLGLETLRLPLGAQENEPHVPILISANLASKKRIIVLFYEHNQDLGILAYRVLGGKGGINAGSAVNLVTHIQSLHSAPDDASAPGIILGNLGQLRWWRRGAQAVTQTTWFALPLQTAVTGPLRFDPVRNTIPCNRTTYEHVSCVLGAVRQLAAPDARVDLLGVSDGAVGIVDFLNKPDNWKTWGHRVAALALVSPYHHRDDITNPMFADWLRKRGRAYTVSEEPAGIPLAGPEGRKYIQGYGCPVYGLGEPYYSELMLVRGYKDVLEWFQKVHWDAEYENDEIIIFDDGDDEGEVGAGTGGAKGGEPSGWGASDVWGGDEPKEDVEAENGQA